MKDDLLKSHWKQLKGELRERWDRLSADDVEDIRGDRELLLGMLQEYYGMDREQSERELQQWLKARRAPDATSPRKRPPEQQTAAPDAPGADPVGVAIGAAGGAAAGAAVGSLGGPVGSVVGAAVGGLAGGLAGKAVAEVDPAREDAYWQASYRSAPYVDPAHDYRYYQPAYRFGWESYSRYGRRSFHEIDEALMREWDTRRGASLQTWDEARAAARDAFERVARGQRPRSRAAGASEAARNPCMPAAGARNRSARRQAGRGGVRKRARS